VSNRDRVVELTRVQPFEAQVILAKLRASGIEASVGADSPYDSLTYADGVSVFVAAEDASQAQAVLEDAEPD
jgi:hypothetical protein